MQAITKGLEKVEQELSISEKDPPETDILQGWFPSILV